MKVIQKITLFLVFSGYTIPAIAMWASQRNLVSRGAQFYSSGKYGAATPNLDPVLQKTAIAGVFAEKNNEQNNEQNNNRQSDDTGESWWGKQWRSWRAALFGSSIAITPVAVSKVYAAEHNERNTEFSVADIIELRKSYKHNYLLKYRNQDQICHIVQFCADNIQELAKDFYGRLFLNDLIKTYPDHEHILIRAIIDNILELAQDAGRGRFFLLNCIEINEVMKDHILSAVATRVVEFSKDEKARIFLVYLVSNFSQDFFQYVSVVTHEERSALRDIIDLIKIEAVETLLLNLVNAANNDQNILEAVLLLLERSPHMIEHVLPLLRDKDSTKIFFTSPLCLARFSIDASVRYVTFLELFYEKPLLFDNLAGATITKVLLNAPEKEYACLIKTLLAYIGKQNQKNISDNDRLTLASVIADICVLFKLNIDIKAHAADQSFANIVLESIQDLQESYAYHKKVDENKEIKAWVKEKLALEHKMIIEDKCGTIWNEPAAKDNDDQCRYILNNSNLSKYIKRKLEAVGASWCDKIAIMSSGYASYGFTDGYSYTCVNEQYLTVDSALSWNWALAHEAMHAFDNHKDRAAAVIEDIPHNLMLIRAYHEKYADVYAALLAGPKACRAAARLIFNSGDLRNPQHDCHASGSVRAAVLLDLVRIMEEGTFNPARKTPIVRWLQTRCEHPEVQDFVRLFYQCEDGKCEPGSRVMISPEGNGIGQSHFVQMQEPYHKWVQGIETEQYPHVERCKEQLQTLLTALTSGEGHPYESRQA